MIPRPRDLRAICQAGKESDPGWYAIHRRVSIYLTWALLHTRVTPNQVTLSMMVLGAVGAVLLASPSLSVNLAGFGLLYLSFLCDKVDGELARYRGVQSARAILLDRFHHLAIEPAILFAAAYRQYQVTDEVGLLVAALVAIILGNIVEEQPHLAAYALLKHRQSGGKPHESVKTPDGWASAAYPWFRALKTFRMFIIVWLSLLILYLLQFFTPLSALSYYIYIASTAVAVYLLFQTFYYYHLKLEIEMASLEPYLRPERFQAEAGPRHRAFSVGRVPDADTILLPSGGTASGPRTVSGARHETPIRIVREPS